ncbi:hypothetical protein HZU75_15205 [Chitinibacter fontanus]|uniref:DUF5666 domain-containing protein n=1 Tax=Chitinibacter fontanus TaxID=1737446 RepID=A0A7D5VB57_9NEIS|nr:hypothetical protein [Chitinibacter fontanus]QLI82759.1 hypothetical protein HZU75_15205 [Chitinibacter fontanus]
MKNRTVISAVLLAAGIWLNGPAFAAEEQVVVSETVRNRVEAIVESVDFANRDLIVKMPDGERVEFKSVDAGVTNFDQVKVNDKINVGGSESVAITLRKGTAGVRRVLISEGRDVTADGVGVVRKRETYNDIIAIDVENGLAKVKNPEGQIVEVQVPNKAILSQAAVGDQVIVSARATVIVWGKNQ